ncbi:hypothetical protein MSG28_000602, partial [Choristoneura fumiferana]
LQPRFEEACDLVCMDLPANDMQPVCMMFSRYKKGYLFFEKLSFVSDTAVHEQRHGDNKGLHQGRNLQSVFVHALAAAMMQEKDSSVATSNRRVELGPRDPEKLNAFYEECKRKNKVHAAKPKRTIKRESFEESLKTIMIIGHCFGLMPVDGLINSKKRGVSSTCITMAMFLHVASNWPKLIKHVVKTEDLDPNMDTMEHILSLVSAFTGAMVCYPNTNVYEGFVKFFYPWVFKFLPYTTLLGMITQFLHFQATFIWNFSDLFVICMSYYLTSRLENINKKLILVQGKYLSELFWRSTREDYGRATQLVRKIDEVISGIVFISFANNLFFVCLQLFNTLEKSPFGGYEAGAYFLFSLIYLISRSIAVSLIASQVNSASTVAAPILYDVPSPVYCIEIAGTIVTYELVMFQFKTPQQPAGSQSTPNVTN